MSEFEKMLNGEIYNPMDKELIQKREKCKTLCYEYNATPPFEKEKREEIIKKILGKTGKNFIIEQPFIADYGTNVEIGENFYSNHNLTILDANKVKFGNNVFLGPNCAFYPPSHPLDYRERNKGIEWANSIEVGDNVWFGGSVIVLGRVKIGSNGVIGAGSVVTKDIEDNCVALGSPAKVIRKLKP